MHLNTYNKPQACILNTWHRWSKHVTPVINVYTDSRTYYGTFMNWPNTPWICKFINLTNEPHRKYYTTWFIG